jgi:hypothetical protein
VTSRLAAMPTDAASTNLNTLSKTRKQLSAAHCMRGKVEKPKRHNGKLVVKSQSPSAGPVTSVG